ncbi:MAG: type 1 glutamine amidotransferase [Candidatus Bathyarchaeota archaeon]|nr:MAG: type 1 glutamine amidotransferase [Candidatus Bathyarchaeota archaeon]
MKKVLIMIDDGFEDSEFLYPYYRFQEEGYEVDVVGSKAKAVYRGKHGVPFKADLSPKEVNITEYKAVIIPGGKAPDRMRLDRGLVDIIKLAHKKNFVIAAICHGPQMLIEADILHGKKATCWYSVATDLKNAGANFVDISVAIDGNIVTSRHPADLPQFCKEAIKLLKKRTSK